MPPTEGKRLPSKRGNVSGRGKAPSSSAMPITEALRTIDFDMTMAQWHFWRARGRAIYAQLNDWPDDEGDPQIGLMETDVLAEGAATAHNTALRSVQREGWPN